MRGDKVAKRRCEKPKHVKSHGDGPTSDAAGGCGSYRPRRRRHQGRGGLKGRQGGLREGRQKWDRGGGDARRSARGEAKLKS